uniref:hypothetical protein n=1 Tax=Qipengyuania sp. TaxID=2004515 RepID=UPI0035C872D8
PAIVLPEPVVEESTPVAATNPAANASARPAQSTATVSTRNSSPEPVARTEPAAGTAGDVATNDVQPATAPQPITSSDALGNELMTGATTASSQPLAAAAPAEPTVASDNGTNELAIAGVLGALGLAAVGGIAFLASRRRRTSGTIAEATPIERTLEPAAPVGVKRQNVATTYAAPERQAAPAMAYAPPAYTSTNGDPVPLPSSAPTSYAERDSLLRRLIDAKPDRANPFKSPAARARRARLIIQSLGRNFENRKPRFDLSQYSNRWPALRGWQPATA